MRLRSFTLKAGLVLLAAYVSACTPIGAAVTAGSTVGVAAVEERGVGGAFSDTSIRLEINHLWLQRSETILSKTGLTVHEGRVMLTGGLPDTNLMVQAVSMAWQPDGVREVINEIQIGGSRFIDEARDTWISAKLESQLLFDSTVSHVNYRIDVSSSVIYLIGVAQDADELNRVLAHAESISNVRQVVNHVLLKGDPKRNAPPEGQAKADAKRPQLAGG